MGDRQRGGHRRGTLGLWAAWAVGGVVLAFPFLVPALAFLAWVAPLPWLLALAEEERRLFWPAWLGGTVYVLTGVGWLLESGVLPWVVNAVFFGLYVGATSWALARCRRRLRLPLWFLGPVVWGGGEVLRLVACLFPTTILALGNNLVGLDRVRQAAEVGGVFGLSLLPLVVSGVLAEGLLCWRGGEEKFYRSRRVLGGAAVAAALVAGCWVYGAWRLSGMAVSRGPAVALVQPAIPQSVRNVRANARMVLARHIGLTRSARLGEAELVVWPESAATLYLESEPDVLRALAALNRDTGRPLIMGAMGEVRGPGGDPAPTNSAFLLDLRGQVRARWDKRQLVPMAESLPVVGRIPAVRRGLGGWLHERFSFYPFLVPGDRALVVPVPGAGWRVGVTICYGDVLPRMSRELADGGADVIAVISNEAWFGRTHLHQHLAMARLRAVETRRPVVRATNTGMTAVIDPDGEVRSALEPGRRGVLVEQVGRTPLNPPPAWVPRGFAWLLLVGACLLLGATWVPALSR